MGVRSLRPSEHTHFRRCGLLKWRINGKCRAVTGRVKIGSGRTRPRPDFRYIQRDRFSSKKVCASAKCGCRKEVRRCEYIIITYGDGTGRAGGPAGVAPGDLLWSSGGSRCRRVKDAGLIRRLYTLLYTYAGAVNTACSPAGRSARRTAAVPDDARTPRPYYNDGAPTLIIL